MIKPLFTVLNTLEALNLFSHYMREAWRLQNQGVSSKNPLPEPLRPTENTAMKDLKRLVSLDASYGGNFKAWITEAIDKVQGDFGDLRTWVQEDVTISSELEWSSLATHVRDAVEEARVAIQKKGISPDFDWEIAGRASVALSFALRAADALSREQAEGTIPDGARASKRFHPRSSSILQVHITDGSGAKIGISDNLEGAIKEAVISQAARKQTHELTPKEFLATTTVVNVDLGRGKTGLAKTGPQRLLLSSLDDIGVMRSFLHKALERTVGQDGLAEDPESSKSWVDNAMTTILASPFQETLKMFRIEGAGHLVLNRGAHIGPHELTELHRQYVKHALLEGKDIPDRVLEATGLDAGVQPNAIRMRQTA